ncbi:MAG: tripartite tricarboxylate transporter substrate binding protein [Woeseiaceae bacterium]|nr:tripartite tricarboxylate transporter substrate binding protein [Woeseiaceae bacterium]
MTWRQQGRRLCRWLLLLLPLAGCAPGEDDGTISFDNETVTIVIPYRPGGGFDRAVRAFAPYYARELGTDVNILPENLPGAGGRRAATKVYRARPDGTTLGIFNLPGFVLPEILGEPVDYDLRELSWIGRIESQRYVLLAAATSDIRTLDDVRALPEVTFLSTGYGSSVLAAMQIMAEELGLADPDPIYLTGYPGTADVLVGLVRGDGNLSITPVSTALKYVESGDLRAIAIAGGDSNIEGVPTFAELGYPGLMALDVQRSLAGPPAMEPGLLEFMRAAFMRAVTDPEFEAMAARARLELAPLDGAATAAAVSGHYTFYEAFKTNLTNPNAR